MIQTEQIKDILTGKRPFIDVWHYLLGNYRYKLYYNKKLTFLIRKHIFEQISYRIKLMDRDCFSNGSCKMCGCETTHLQMCNKPCEKPCYPTMMSKQDWNLYKNGSLFIDKNGGWVVILHEDYLTSEPIFVKKD